MKVSVKDISSCEKQLTILVSEEVIAKEFNLFYTEAAKSAKIPGFRPGKAPRHILELHFKETAREEVLKRLIPDSLRNAFHEKGLAPISSPSVEKIDFQPTRLQYEAHIEVRPAIKISKYKGLTVKQKPVVVEEQEISDALKRLQESHAKYVPVEDRPAAMGDFITCDYVCLADGKEVEKRSEDMISLKEKDFLEGFSTQLAGVMPGEAREVRVKFPGNYMNKEMAGKEALFQVKVHEIKSREMPVLNDDFAKEVGEYQTLDELKKKIIEEVNARKKHDQEAELENGLIDQLLKNSKFDLPRRMVSKRLDMLIEETVQRLRYQGLQEEAEASKKEELRKELQGEAERQVRISFLLDEIALKEKIGAIPQDYKEKYALLAQRYRRPIEEIEAHFEKSEHQKESLAMQIISEKAIQHLKDHAVIKTA